MTNRWANPINNNILRDLEGTVLASGSVAFYTAGTSSPLAVYSDPELTISLGSFINADAFGLLPDFHLASGTQYKMVAYNAVGGAGGAGAVKWTRDDVFGLDSAVDTRLDGIEASIAALETGKNSIINGGCSAKNLASTGLVISAPSLTTSFVEGQAAGVRAKVANVTAGTQAIGYSTDSQSGAYLHLSGVTTNNAAATADAMFQVISGEASRFINEQVTFRCKVYHDIGSAKNFTITVATPNSRDDVSAYTTISTGSANSVADSTWTSISLTVADMGNCSNGIVVIVSGAVGTITTKNIRFTEAQIDAGSTLSNFSETDPAIAEGALNTDKAITFAATAESNANAYTDTEIIDFAKRDAGSPYLNGIGAIQKLTGSGNFTVPAGVYRIKVRQIAGGGGGGHPTQSGGTGGNTVFGAFTANGGTGALSNGQPGTGGTGGTASNFNSNGGDGIAAGANAAGTGGAGMFGTGGRGARLAVTDATAGTAFGSGGGGGEDTGYGSGGGAGEYLENVISVTPAQIIAYSIGAGGAAAAGTPALDAAAGAPGTIIVEY